MDRITAPFDAGLRAKMRAKMHGSPWLPKRVKIVIKDGASASRRTTCPSACPGWIGRRPSFTDKGVITQVTHALTAGTLDGSLTDGRIDPDVAVSAVR